MWAIFEKLLSEAYLNISSPATRFKVLGLVLKEMRNYKTNYEGEKANDLHRRYLFCQLKQFEIQSKDVQVMAINCCPYCAMLNGKKVTVEEALDEQYLPTKSCTNEIGCNCFYKAE